MRNSWVWISLLSVVGIAAPLAAEEDPSWSGMEKLLHLLSPKYRQIENRTEAIQPELESLPRPKQNVWGSRHGHRSADLKSETQADWIQADFGEPCLIDTVVLVPAVVGYQEEVSPGYGFPKRFRIQLADNPDMEGAFTVVEIIDADFENPGSYPAVFRIAPTKGRYLRFTSLKHTSDEESFFWAMEEIMALEGNINVAYGSYNSSSSRMDLFPIWAPLRAFNGQSRLGMPVDVTAKSPSQGYLSASLSVASAGRLSKPETWKWCGVDLGEICRIDQIRILPLESDHYQVFGGRGFPRGFRLELAMDEDFEQIVWQTSASGFRLGYPASWAMMRKIPDVEARYVRFVAFGMWARDNVYAFGLSELQVYSNNQNIALGKSVFVRDQADLPGTSGWAPEYLVDGYTSHYRLIEWPEYLDLLERRSGLERELKEQLRQREAMLFVGQRIFEFTIRLLVLLVLLVIVWLLWRPRYLQRKALQRLREQIARDLHDDIGSNLGGIVLLSEAGSESSRDDESKQDFRVIHEAAEQAASAMRDIVWLVQPEQVTLKEMIKRMREVADMLLGETELEFTVQPQSFKDRNLSLFFRRHAFLAFKETCNNVRKHAQAVSVSIRIEIEANRLLFRVEDDGLGFGEEEDLIVGYGLSNLRRRASRVQGSVDINSASGQGTVVTFEAPFTT